MLEHKNDGGSHAQLKFSMLISSFPFHFKFLQRARDQSPRDMRGVCDLNKHRLFMQSTHKLCMLL